MTVSSVRFSRQNGKPFEMAILPHHRRQMPSRIGDDRASHLPLITIRAFIKCDQSLASHLRNSENICAGEECQNAKNGKSFFHRPPYKMKKA